MEKLNPGSDAALAAGCRCPVIDNGHGSGYYRTEEGPLFVINFECPLHGEVEEGEKR